MLVSFRIFMMQMYYGKGPQHKTIVCKNAVELVLLDLTKLYKCTWISFESNLQRMKKKTFLIEVLMNEIELCCWKGAGHLFREVYAFPTFKYCAQNEAYTSFYAHLQCWPLPISLFPRLCWSGLCAWLWMSLWISFSPCDDLPSLLLLRSLWTKLMFFVQKWQTYTRLWPSGNAICFSQFFELCHLCYVTFVFCCLFASCSDYYDRSGRRLHKSSRHSAKKKEQSVLMRVREVLSAEC